VLGRIKLRLGCLPVQRSVRVEARDDQRRHLLLGMVEDYEKQRVAVFRTTTPVGISEDRVATASPPASSTR
ncbi:MAG: hypothetical protein KDD69_15980, partial [Bdellovibrionales bacterium]|nr:hypothetical protein [Bdellovibrionales bacterium]